MKTLVAQGLNIDLPIYLSGKNYADSHSMLTYSDKNGNVELCEVLLKSGADPNQDMTGTDHSTPLSALVHTIDGKALAACELLELLVGFGGDLHAAHPMTRFIQSSYYNWLLHCTEGKEHWSNVPQFIETVKKVRNNGPILLIREVIKSNADLSKPVKHDFPYLHYCADHLWYDCMTELINAGADVNYRTSKSGNNCLHILAGKKNPSAEMIRLLIDKGLDLTKKNQKGKTPKMIADENGNGALFPN